MPDYAKILLAIAPHGKPAVRAGFAASLPDAIERADLTTPLRLAHFLAQAAQESDGFATTVEYASGRGYEGRADLGNTQRGDGVRYKGRGVFQLTGRFNYRAVGKALGLDLEGNPDLAAAFPAAILIAAEYWRSRLLNRYADRDDIRSITHGINGGYNGIATRQLYLARAKQALRDNPPSPAPTPKPGAVAAPAPPKPVPAVVAKPAPRPPAAKAAKKPAATKGAK
jgi:putative chitinase